MKLWSCWDGQFTQPHFFLGTCCGISLSGGEDYTDILVLYVGAGHFWGFKTLNFNTFWGFTKRKLIFFRGGGGGGGYEEIVDIFWGQLQIGLFLGSFLYILRLSLRPRYRMGMFLGITKFQGFFFLGGGGGRVCLIFLFIWVGGKQWMHEEKLRVAPINDTFSVLSFYVYKGC